MPDRHDTAPAPGEPVRSTGPASAGAPAAPALFRQEIPSAAYAIDMVRIPGDPARGVAPFWISTTEVTWDAFDVYVYHLDEGGEQGAGAPAGAADAATRPSKPYLPPDRGFGHEGFAAICLSHASAEGFCAWLSRKSGRRFRLPTEDEWERACGPAPGAAEVGEAAWYGANSEQKPHRVAGKKPNALGLFDMLGNVSEWVNGRDGKPVVKGGSYLDGVEAMSPAWRQPAQRAWNASDPQIPKSRWWLADAPFVGFRVACEDPSPAK